jgi:hypothetical protein
MSCNSIIFICFVFLIFVFNACKIESEICGDYSSETKKNYKSSKMIFATGTTLKIQCDSSFTMTTCGNIIKGKWVFKNDSIILICHSNRYKLDSLNKSAQFPKCNTMRLYKKNKNEIINVLDTNYNGYILVDLLQKR